MHNANNNEVLKTANELKALAKIVKTCRRCSSHLYHHTHTQACIHHLDDLTLREINDVDKLLKRKDIQQVAKELRAFWNEHETAGEFHHAKAILDNPAPKRALFAYHLFDRYAIFIREEGKMAELKKNETVLFLGSGPFPLSAILLTKLFGVNVTCIDSCNKCVLTSRQLVKKIGLQKKIKIMQGDARSTVLRYDAIWVAALAQPKKAIIQHLSNAPESTRIIVRTSHGLRTIIYEHIPDKFFKKFDKKMEWRAKGNVKNSSILLTTKTTKPLKRK